MRNVNLLGRRNYKLHLVGVSLLVVAVLIACNGTNDSHEELGVFDDDPLSELYSNKEDINQDGEKFITSFYQLYVSIPYDIDNFGDIDSLRKFNCTPDFYSKLKKEFDISGLDHDYITNDELMDNHSIETMEVKRLDNNMFLVVFETQNDDTSNLEFRKSSFEVELERTMDKFLINNVCCF